MGDKPHLGSIRNWSIHDYGEHKLVWGVFVDHPDFAGLYGHTSYIVAHNKETGEIETRNSRYRLIGPAMTNNDPAKETEE